MDIICVTAASDGGLHPSEDRWSVGEAVVMSVSTSVSTPRILPGPSRRSSLVIFSCVCVCNCSPGGIEAVMPPQNPVLRSPLDVIAHGAADATKREEGGKKRLCLENKMERPSRGALEMQPGKIDASPPAWMMVGGGGQSSRAGGL